MSGLQCLASESVWFDKHRFDEAEKRFYEGANGPAPQQQQVEKTIRNFNKIINILGKQIFILDNIYFHVLSLLLLVSERPVDSRMAYFESLASEINQWLHHCLKAAVWTRVKPPSLEVAHQSKTGQVTVRGSSTEVLQRPEQGSSPSEMEYLWKDQAVREDDGVCAKKCMTSHLSVTFTQPLCITVMTVSHLGGMMDQFLKDPTFTRKSTQLRWFVYLLFCGVKLKNGAVCLAQRAIDNGPTDARL